MVRSDFSLPLLFGHFTPSTSQVTRFGLVVYEGRIKRD